jgi:hypothetical protein
MNRQTGTFCKTILFVMLWAALPALAQNGKVKTRVERDSSNHTTIVIHDTRPEAYARQRDAADRAQQAREARLQRQHELEMAKIQADAQVRVARAQQMVAQAPAPAPVVVRPENRRPSYRNGGQFTGFSDFFVGSPVWGGGFYGGGFYGGGYGYGGGYNCRPAMPIRCR